MADEPQPVPIPVKTAKGVNPTWTAAQMAPETAPASSQPAVPLETLPPPGPPEFRASPGPLPSSPPPEVVIPTIPAATTSASGDGLRPDAQTADLSTNQPPPVPPLTPPELALVPAARPPLPWRAIGIGAGVVVILGLILAFLWWQGILFGAPRNGLKAVGQMLTALAAQDAYHAEGEATITLQMPPDSDETSTITMTFRGDRAGANKQQATVGVDLAGLSQTLPVSLPTALELETRRVDDQLFLRLPILALLLGSNENQWLELPLADIPQPAAHANRAQLDQTRLAAVVRSARRVGYERIGPVKTAHYKLILDSAALATLLTGAAADQGAIAEQLASTYLTVDLWLGVKDRLPYRAELRSSSVGKAVTVVTTASFQINNYGQSVAITAPDPSEVRSEGLDTLLKTDVASIEVKARDGQRKADLRQIQRALELYRGDHGRYPDSQGKIARSNDRRAALSTLTEQGYLAVLPVDPHDPDQWYGYVSQGGDHYELWSLLENLADPDGQQRDKYYIYLLTDTKVDVQAVRSATPVPTASAPAAPTACGPSTNSGRLPAGC